MELIRKVEEDIRRYGMIGPGDRVIAGVSGGADSVALLLCLDALKETLSFELSAVHVNHGIRGEEAERDQIFVRELCLERHIPLTEVVRDVPALAAELGLSPEEAGRRVRYEVFEERRRVLEAEGAGRVRIAVAHHMDDQAETVLLNLCRGTGIRGMGAMSPVNGAVIRPMLELRKEEILSWMKGRGQIWMEDGTNSSDSYTRNRIRNTLIPGMEELVNSRTVFHLAALAEQAREADDYLQQEAERWLRENGETFPEGELRLDSEALRSVHPALGKRILLTALSRIAEASKDLTARHAETLWDLARGARGRRADLPRDILAVREENLLMIRRKTGEKQDTDLSREWQLECRIFPYTGQFIPEKEYTKWFDYDKIQDTVQMRTRRTGDTIVLAGVGRKSLNRYMIDAHIPASRRDRIPVIADGDRVMWLVGYRMSAEYQVQKETKTIIAVTCSRSEDRQEPG